MYGLGVGISTVFEIFSQFPVSGGWGWSLGPYLMYCIYCMYKRNKNMYGLGVGSQYFSRYLANFPFLGVRLTPGPYLMYCLYCL
jgi:hypothetical protein